MQELPNQDVNSNSENDVEKENIPLPPMADVPVPIEAPPSEEKPPIKDDRDVPKQIV